MSQAPRLTVLFPVFNGERYLDEAMESILGQTFENFEVIALNDGSSDRTPEMLENYALRDSRVRVLHHPNMGLGATLNRGLAESQVGLIARQDDDDISYPERFERQIAYMDANPNVVLLGTSSMVIDDEGIRLFEKIVPTADRVLRDMLLTTSPFYHGSVVFRRQSAIDASGYPNLRWYEDLFLWRSLARKGDIANLDEVLYEYRMTPFNWHLPRQLRREVVNMFLRIWPDDDMSPEDFELLENVRRKLTPEIRRAQYHIDVAKGLSLHGGDRPFARRHLLRAIRVKPLMLDIWFNLIVNLLPMSVGEWWDNRRTRRLA